MTTPRISNLGNDWVYLTAGKKDKFVCSALVRHVEFYGNTIIIDALRQRGKMMAPDLGTSFTPEQWKVTLS